MLERSLRTMGTEIRVLVGPPLDPALPGEEAVLATVERELLDFNRRLSRFLPDSELSQLNSDPREVVPASELLRAAVRAGVWGAARTNGLVDPTLLPRARGGRVRGLTRGGPLGATERSPRTRPGPRRPAGPNPRAAWRSIEVLDDAGAIRRPPGLRFDTGGTGKGLAADLVAARLAGYSRYAIDCGGDVRVGGANPDAEPIEIEIRHPLTGGAADEFRAGNRRGGDVGPGRPPLAACRRQLRPSSDRPGHRRAGMDGPDLRQRPRADRPGGRRARQGGIAERAGRRDPGARRSTAG